MKKFAKLAAGIVICCSMTAGAALAQSNCTITGPTGPGSNTQCVSNQTTTVTYTCTNGVLINNTTGQAANSGSANSNGNTTSGGASSGTALNNGQTTTDVNATCAPAQTTSNPTNPSTPVGQGSAVAGASTSTKPKIAALPKTGNVSALQTLSLAAASVGTLGLITKAGLAIYRKRVLNN